jgi:hypothetical protein
MYCNYLKTLKINKKKKHIKIIMPFCAFPVKRKQKMKVASGGISTGRKEALHLYRDILRTSRLFDSTRDQSGRIMFVINAPFSTSSVIQLFVGDHSCDRVLDKSSKLVDLNTTQKISQGCLSQEGIA